MASCIKNTRTFYGIQNSIKLCCRKIGSLEIVKNPYQTNLDDVIDVRSPHEYEADHIPGAINLPVLEDAQHHNIGKLYYSQPFEARKQGACLVTQNISHHIDTYFKDKPDTYRPLIYCLRGGQRSKSLATILSEIGFHVTVLEGGYKSYRKNVRQCLETLPDMFTYKVIAGKAFCYNLIVPLLNTHQAHVILHHQRNEWFFIPKFLL